MVFLQGRMEPGQMLLRERTDEAAYGQVIRGRTFGHAEAYAAVERAGKRGVAALPLTEAE